MVNEVILGIIISIIILGMIYVYFHFIKVKPLKFQTTTLLDSEQKNAVRYPYDKPLMVAAGPGSGKTRVVAERVKDLILNQDVKPEKILCVTFTRAGQKAMEDRLKTDKDLEKEGVKFPNNQVRTFH